MLPAIRQFAATAVRQVGPHQALLVFTLWHFTCHRYEVFTCFLGKGDKETFAYGMATAKEAYHMIETPPGSVGTVGESACRPSACRVCL